MSGVPREPHRDSGGIRYWVVVLALVSAVAFGAVIAFVLPTAVLQPGHPGLAPIGPSLQFSDAEYSVCTGASTFQSQGCVVGDRYYFVTANATGLSLGDFGLGVTNGSYGPQGYSPWASAGAEGFSIFDAGGSVVAQYAAVDGVLSMSSGTWSYRGSASSSTALLSSDHIEVDIGPTGPSVSIYLVGVGWPQAGYSGTTEPFQLFNSG